MVPILRTIAPMTCAVPSQTLFPPRPSPETSRAPTRRLLDADADTPERERLLPVDLVGDVLLGRLRVEPDRVLEPRDRDWEVVRVAMS